MECTLSSEVRISGGTDLLRYEFPEVRISSGTYFRELEFSEVRNSWVRFPEVSISGVNVIVVVNGIYNVFNICWIKFIQRYGISDLSGKANIIFEIYGKCGELTCIRTIRT